jgi:glycosyltransferase involved in cell wall biosynthesis
MFLSIVIPTYNRYACLEECLWALMPQITPQASDTEIRVIDDNSGPDGADKNAALCQKTGAGYVFLETNRGAAAARNAGIARSRGEWVAFLDDDVRVGADWLARCRKVLHALPANVIGVEGKVIASGNGLWDREVENVNGGLYLSCHLFLKRDLVRSIGGFDENFKSRYPSAEDHELAARALLRGDIVFEPGLCVYHLPRTINFSAYFRDSSYRMRSQLYGELYFFSKHRDCYHAFRYAGTFWGTYANIVIKHAWSALLRRRPLMLVSHPIQLVLLVLSSALEQLTALILFPFCIALFKSNSHMFFEKCIDINRTSGLWKLPNTESLSKLRLPAHYLKSVLFPLTHRPVYSIAPVLQRINGISSDTQLRIFLRIDDVFLDRTKEVESLCEKLAKRNVPFCAAVIGKDLITPGNEGLIQQIRECGGEIAVHGFFHQGRFGPFDSELLQMNFSKIEAMVRVVNEHFAGRNNPKIFIPPFNALGREQIVYLSRYFKIICGGPETARFTDGFTGPVALANSSWYFPAFHPFYDAATNILKSTALGEVLKLKGFLCVGVHMSVEARDGFKALAGLVDRISEKLTSWKYLYDF